MLKSPRIYLLFFLVFVSLAKAQPYKVYLDSCRLAFLSNEPDTIIVLTVDQLYDLHLWSTGSLEAYKFLKKALELSEKAEYHRGQLMVLNDMAQFNFRKGNYELTLKQRLQGLEVAEFYKDTNAIAANYLALGEVYKAEKNYDQALRYYKLSLHLEEKFIKVERRLGTVYSLVGNMYNELNEDSLAIYYQLKSLSIRLKHADASHVGASQGYVAKTYFKQKNYKLAESYGRAALVNRTKSGDHSGITFVANLLGDIKLMNKKFDSAYYFFNEALQAAQLQNSKIDLKEVYERMSRLYESKGDVNAAFKYHKLYSAMNDSVLNSENIRQMAQMKEVYESERKDNEINLLNQEQIISKKEISEQQEKIKSRNILVGASLLSILLLAGLVIIFIRSNKQKKESNMLLSEKNRLIEEKNKEIIDSINYAKRIQDSLFDNFDQVSRFFSDAMLVYLPKDIVSGDFYWCSKKIMTEKNGANSTVRELFFIAVCDSTGHGVPGGFMSLLNSAYLSEAVNEKNIYEPDKVLNYVRERLINAISKSDQKDGFDGILMCFEKIFSFEGKELKNTEMKCTYAAAHNAPVLISKGKMTILKKNVMPVGYGERKENFTLHEVPIEKGDSFYLYSDGYADQFGGPQARLPGKAFGQGKKFMYRQLDELLLKNNTLFMSQQKDELIDTMKSWRGDIDQIDDILLIGLKV